MYLRNTNANTSGEALSAGYIISSPFRDGFAGVFVAVTIVLIFTAGTALMMWLGEQINQFGIGNGISILLFAGIVSRLPTTLATFWTYFSMASQGGSYTKYYFLVPLVLVLFLALIWVIVFMNDAERRVPIQYAKRVVGRKMYGGQSTHMPIKVSMSGVMPVSYTHLDVYKRQDHLWPHRRQNVDLSRRGSAGCSPQAAPQGRRQPVMLLPKRVKYRRVHRGRLTGKATRGNVVNYGDFGLQALEPAWITSNQIEAARIAMTRYIKRGGQVWIKIFPDKPITEKPAETRMGSGKGSPEYWVAVVKPGRVMFEIGGIDESVAREALRLAANKLPIKCKFVRKNDQETGGEQE